VTRLQGFEGKPEVYIGRVLDYFRQQHFSYTLRPPLMQGHFIEAFCLRRAPVFAITMPPPSFI